MLFIFGLAFLLIISPCKIRNFIQAEFGVPTTQVLNKSQSVLSQSNCQTFNESIQTISKQTIEQPDYLTSEAYNFEFLINSSNNSFSQGTLKKRQVADVPLYILYQNIQVYM
ncbi:hypothetical protein [Winogradskyella bathintestinalis]|uniref:Transmembrane protein n=1 Tax=Winogradskyella bathintestinalis TaxID=3035208 RepID=A0ABT7ZYJ3_9FLAO|nr:hypothetical protein [Winogradskyella bathintestinalis]MDN3494061.1 hypothetical protein [Winogradskyella bathintestinalis]